MIVSLKYELGQCFVLDKDRYCSYNKE